MPIELNWLKSLEVGVPAIDRDHRELVNDANAIARKLQDGDDLDAIVAAVSKMRRDCVDHFRREEAVLREDGFAGAEPHAAEHRRIETEMEDIARRITEFAGPASLIAELALSFHSILLDHLLRYDLKYKSHLMFQRGR